jgi:hypothetical protein
MFGELIVRGEVLASKQATFEGKTSHTIQVMKRTARGSAELMNIKLPDGVDAKDYPDGKTVELPVDVSSYEGTLYYKALSAKKPERTPDSSRAAPTK